MPDGSRHEHGSGVSALGEYSPGARTTNPAGYSAGVTPVHADIVPPRAVERKSDADRRMREAVKAQQPRKRGRPVGSRNRPPIPPEMFDAPPDQS